MADRPMSGGKRTHVVQPVVDGPNGFLGARVAVEWNRILLEMAGGRQGISTEVVLVAATTMFVAYISQIPDPDQREAYISDLSDAVRRQVAELGKATLS